MFVMSQLLKHMLLKVSKFLFKVSRGTSRFLAGLRSEQPAVCLDSGFPVFGKLCME